MAPARRRRRKNLLPRNAGKDMTALERNASQHCARAARLAAAVSDEHILITLGGPRAAEQVPCADERRRQFIVTVGELGGKKGAGLDPILNAIELLAAHATATGDRDSLCIPVSPCLAHYLIGLETDRSRSAGPTLEAAFKWMRDHLKWEIGVGGDVTASAAKRGTKDAVDREGRGKRPKKMQAGTFPLGFKCQLEHVAANPPDKFTRVIARSALALGIDASIRVEDSESAQLLADELEPAKFVRGSAPLSKDGAPINLYSVARGFLGPYTWLEEHLDEVEQLGGRPFPSWISPHGTRRALSRASGWRKMGDAPADSIRGALKEIAAGAPYNMPLSEWGREGDGAHLTGHSQHGSPSDWAKAIGPFPPHLPYANALEDKPARGFLYEETRALGHWLRDPDDERDAPVPAQVHRQRREAGRGGFGIAPGAPARAGEMQNLYTSGDGRVGTRVEQHRLRGRLADYGKAAIDGWCKHWKVPWHRMPRGRADIDLLHLPPAMVPPEGHRDDWLSVAIEGESPTGRSPDSNG